MEEPPVPHVEVDMVVTVHTHPIHPTRLILLLIRRREALPAVEAAGEATAEVLNLVGQGEVRQYFTHPQKYER